mmetsp:Transcript_27627/g.41788  ORF Transcript_27627/g.41788 Transcript_27627/m.41788 type:complete len:288 (+) Transcript_27627:64-927(+)
MEVRVHHDIEQLHHLQHAWKHSSRDFASDSRKNIEFVHFESITGWCQLVSSRFGQEPSASGSPICIIVFTAVASPPNIGRPSLASSICWRSRSDRFSFISIFGCERTALRRPEVVDFVGSQGDGQAGGCLGHSGAVEGATPRGPKHPDHCGRAAPRRGGASNFSQRQARRQGTSPTGPGRSNDRDSSRGGGETAGRREARDWRRVGSQERQLHTGRRRNRDGLRPSACRAAQGWGNSPNDFGGGSSAGSQRLRRRPRGCQAMVKGVWGLHGHAALCVDSCGVAGQGS